MTPGEWIETHNFAGLTPRSITALQSPSHVTSGVQIDDVLNLFSSLEGADVVSLKKRGMVDYLVVTASDEMAIKPGLQFSSQVNGVIGLVEPPVLLPETVKELVGKSDLEVANHFKKCKFNSQALEVHVTSMDDTVSQPVAVYYGGSQGGYQAVDDLHRSLHTLGVCKACILENRQLECTYKCANCWDVKRVCRECAALGLEEWHPAARPCLPCHNYKLECKKLLQLGWCTDCESKQKAFLERLHSRFPDTFQLPMPDPPHNIKSVRFAIFWYWVFLDNNLINLRMLLVVRRDSNPAVSVPMKNAVTIKALKNKDRMSVETAVEMISPEVQRAIPKEDVVTTIVPKIYTFWRQNRPGTLACPVDTAVHQTSGTIFFSDQLTHQVMMSDLHSPATL